MRTRTAEIVGENNKLLSTYEAQNTEMSRSQLCISSEFSSLSTSESFLYPAFESSTEMRPTSTYSSGSISMSLVSEQVEPGRFKSSSASGVQGSDSGSEDQELRGDSRGNGSGRVR